MIHHTQSSDIEPAACCYTVHLLTLRQAISSSHAMRDIGPTFWCLQMRKTYLPSNTATLLLLMCVICISQLTTAAGQEEQCASGIQATGFAPKYCIAGTHIHPCNPCSTHTAVCGACSATASATAVCCCISAATSATSTPNVLNLCMQINYPITWPLHDVILSISAAAVATDLQHP